MDPYREMPDVLSAEEAEEAAIRELGRWRERTQGRILALFVIAGTLVGLGGYWVAREIQFALWQANLVWLSGAAGFGGPFVAFGVVGRIVARGVVRARTPMLLGRLAARYRVKVSRLAEIARMANAF